MVNVVGCDTLTVASSGECVCSNCFGDCNYEFISNSDADYFVITFDLFSMLTFEGDPGP
jgi:hypothetical protein